MVLAYIYFIISVNMAVASFLMLQHKNRNIVRILGLMLAYLAAIIALKVYYMIG